MRRWFASGVLLLVACGDARVARAPAGHPEADAEVNAPRPSAGRARAAPPQAAPIAPSGARGAGEELRELEPSERAPESSLGSRIRDVGATEPYDPKASARLVESIEADPALVREAARLLAETQDEAVLRVFRDGLAGRFLGRLWRPARDDLLRAAETPGPTARRVAALHALGFCEGFRATDGGGADPLVRAAVFRQLPGESDPEVVFAAAMCLGYGRFSDAERATVLDAARRVPVPHDRATPANHPVRIARRVLYEDLGSDALLRDDWSAMLDALDCAPTQNERDDVTAGFVLACDYLRAPRVAATDPAQRAAALARRGETIERFYRAAEDLAARRRIVGTIVSGRGLLTAASTAPDDERRAAAAVLSRLAEFETDPETLAVLRAPPAEYVADWDVEPATPPLLPDEGRGPPPR